MNCKNCNSELSGSWCHQCGQKVNYERLTLKSILENFIGSIFNLEKGFLFTAKELVMRPGKVVNEYLDGATIRYYNPIRYSIVIMGVYSLFFIYTGLFDLYSSDMLKGFKDSAQLSEEASMSQQNLMTQLKSWMNLLSILVVPFFALGSRLVFYKYKMFYAEHVLMNLYFQSQTTIYGTVLMIPAIFFPEHVSLIVSSSMVVSYLVMMQFINSWLGIKGLKLIFQTLISYILGLIFYTLFTSVFGLIWGLANSLH